MQLVMRAFMVCLTVGISGCARTPQAVTRPSEMYPLQTKKPGDGYAVTYDARGRGAYLVKVGTEATTGPDGKPTTTKRSGLVFCAEPPPDAAANVSANREVNAAIEAMVKMKVVEVAAKGSGGTKDSASSEIASVATRTELVLLMRDALYRICEMNANGVLSDERAEEVFRQVLSTARTLGQRDNVGKLIDVLAVVAQNPNAATNSPKLVDELVSTIRLLALGDQLVQSDQGASGIAAAFASQIILAELAKVDDGKALETLSKLLVPMLEALKKRLGNTRGPEAADVASKIKMLEEIARSLNVPLPKDP